MREEELKHRPKYPHILDREDRKFYNLPPCTCGHCKLDMEPENPWLEPPENFS